MNKRLFLSSWTVDPPEGIAVNILSRVAPFPTAVSYFYGVGLGGLIGVVSTVSLNLLVRAMGMQPIIPLNEEMSRSQDVIMATVGLGGLLLLIIFCRKFYLPSETVFDRKWWIRGLIIGVLAMPFSLCLYQFIINRQA